MGLHVLRIVQLREDLTKSNSIVIIGTMFSRSKPQPGVEITPVNGDAALEGSTGVLPMLDLQKRGSSTPKGSRLESALDKLGLQKRKVSYASLSGWCIMVRSHAFIHRTVLHMCAHECRYLQHRI